ncbi:MAG: type II toxin-antitoxin system prevent-host-death family antitoxin [Dehalococcoidia bacterium]
MAITIGIRELRQHASLYLRRVRAGEVITVTDRGEPVAELRPIPKEGVLERLEREGRLSRAKGDLADLPPPRPPTPGVPLPSEILKQMREHER